MIAVYRNLNKAKRDKRKFVWSVTHANASGNRGKLIEHVERISLVRPRAMVKAGAMRRIQSKGVREVGAWISGVRNLDGPPSGTWYAITMNPLPPDKHGRSELQFHYCAFVEGEVRIFGPVDFSRVKSVEFTSKGCFVVV